MRILPSENSDAGGAPSRSAPPAAAIPQPRLTLRMRKKEAIAEAIAVSFAL